MHSEATRHCTENAQLLTSFFACLFVCFADGVLDMSPTDNFGIHPRHHLRPMCSYVSSGTTQAWWWVGLMSWTQTESSSPALVCSILTSKSLKGLIYIGFSPVDIAQPNGEKSSNKKWVFSVHKNYSKLATAAAITGSEIHLQTSLQHQMLKETQKRENFLFLKLKMDPRNFTTYSPADYWMAMNAMN